MLRIFIRHSYLKLTRSHFFERSLAIKLAAGILVLFIAWYIYFFGLYLPGWLLKIMPERLPHEALFSVLIFIYAGDLLLRLFMQKIPGQQSMFYLHLPLKRSWIAGHILMQSWFSPYNFYLLFFFVPFFKQTVLPNYPASHFYQILTGCFLLGGINHSIVLLWKTARQKTSAAIPVGFFLVLVLGLLTWWQPAWVMEMSLKAGQSLMKGDILFFGLLLAALACMQFLIRKNLQKSLYDLYGQAEAKERLSASLIPGWLEKIPDYGTYWNLEWKLLTRNKRSKNAFYQTPLNIPIMVLILFYIQEDYLLFSLPVLMLGMGSYGFSHLQYVFSWESRFFDYIASRPFNLLTFIRAKYYFYALIALVQYILIIAVSWIINPVMIPLITGTFLYISGAVFCMMFFTGLGHSTRIDPNKKAFFNFEGNSGSLLLIMMIISTSVIPLMLIASLLPLPVHLGFSIVSGLTGMLFILFNKVWTARLARKFENRKYHNLNKYREN